MPQMINSMQVGLRR